MSILAVLFLVLGTLLFIIPLSYLIYENFYTPKRGAPPVAPGRPPTGPAVPPTAGMPGAGVPPSLRAPPRRVKTRVSPLGLQRRAKRIELAKDIFRKFESGERGEKKPKEKLVEVTKVPPRTGEFIPLEELTKKQKEEHFQRIATETKEKIQRAAEKRAEAGRDEEAKQLFRKLEELTTGKTVTKEHLDVLKPAEQKDIFAEIEKFGKVEKGEDIFARLEEHTGKKKKDVFKELENL